MYLPLDSSNAWLQTKLIDIALHPWESFQWKTNQSFLLQYLTLPHCLSYFQWTNSPLFMDMHTSGQSICLQDMFVLLFILLLQFRVGRLQVLQSFGGNRIQCTLLRKNWVRLVTSVSIIYSVLFNKIQFSVELFYSVCHLLNLDSCSRARELLLSGFLFLNLFGIRIVNLCLMFPCNWMFLPSVYCSSTYLSLAYFKWLCGG